jgi:isopenicillin N synthase-like dioxygenase
MPPRGLLDDLAWTNLHKNSFFRLTVEAAVQAKMRSAYDIASAFFDQSLTEKIGSRQTANAGYRPYGIERSKSPEHFDEIESFSVTRKTTPPQFENEIADQLHGRLLDLLDLLEPIAEEIVAAIASRVADVPRERFRSGLREWSYVQLNRRFEVHDGAEFTSDAHDDACVLTLMSNTGPGLEIQGPDGCFYPIEIAPTELIAFPGEVLSLLSGRTLPATFHRVRVAPGQRRRMALLLFADLDPRRCMPWVINDSNRDVDMRKFVLQSPTFHGLEAWKLQE